MKVVSSAWCDSRTIQTQKKLTEFDIMDNIWLENSLELVKLCSVSNSNLRTQDLESHALPARSRTVTTYKRYSGIKQLHMLINRQCDSAKMATNTNRQFGM